MSGDSSSVLARHIAALNAGVEGHDFEPMGDGLTEDCSMRFEGIPVGPYAGRAAIVAAYRTNPPDDRFVLLEQRVEPARVEATYAWSRKPHQPAGRILLDLEGELISAITVQYWSD
jgi:steroid Delta-isomerase